jgi:hypothetical protein
MFFQQAPEVEDRGFIGDPIQVQPLKLVQDRCFVERFFHCRIAVAEPVLHQMNPQHGQQRMRRIATLAGGDSFMYLLNLAEGIYVGADAILIQAADFN